VRSHHPPDPELVDDADLAARHVAALGELERQTRLAETATRHLQQARHELCRLRDVLDRQRRRRRSGLGLATVLVVALVAFGRGLGLGAWYRPDGSDTAGRLACVPRAAPPRGGGSGAR
jgi:hypothetical protein